MKSNIKVAHGLLELASEDQLITKGNVAEKSGVHPSQAGEFLTVWTATEWLTKERAPWDHRLRIYSITEEGLAGLTRLIAEND